MEEDEIAFEEGLMANIEGFTNDKEATEVYKLHPKLIPLLLSIVFMLVSFTVVSYVSFVFKWTFLSMSRNLNNSSYFSNQQKNTAIVQFITPNLVNLRSFIRILCKLIKIWDP